MDLRGSGEDLDSALQLALMATSASPDMPELMDTLGWVYYKKNLPLLALPQFSRSAEKAPENPVFHYHLGLAHLQAGDPVKGRSALERALQAKPDPATVAEIQRLLAEGPASAPTSPAPR